MSLVAKELYWDMVHRAEKYQNPLMAIEPVALEAEQLGISKEIIKEAVYQYLDLLRDMHDRDKP